MLDILQWMWASNWRIAYATMLWLVTLACLVEALRRR